MSKSYPGQSLASPANGGATGTDGKKHTNDFTLRRKPKTKKQKARDRLQRPPHKKPKGQMDRLTTYIIDNQISMLANLQISKNHSERIGANSAHRVIIIHSRLHTCRPFHSSILHKLPISTKQTHTSAVLQPRHQEIQ